MRGLNRWRLFLANGISNRLLPKHFNRARKCRAWIYRNIAGLKIGKNVRMYGGTYILSSNVTIGDNTFLGADCLLTSSDKVPICIGANCDISLGVCFVCGTHEIGPPEQRAGKGYLQPITVGDGTWIGCRATILAGVTIGHGCIVGAASLVNKDVPDSTLVVGVPAEKLRNL